MSTQKKSRSTKKRHPKVILESFLKSLCRWILRRKNRRFDLEVPGQFLVCSGYAVIFPHRDILPPPLRRRLRENDRIRFVSAWRRARTGRRCDVPRSRHGRPARCVWNSQSRTTGPASLEAATRKVCGGESVEALRNGFPLARLLCIASNARCAARRACAPQRHAFVFLQGARCRRGAAGEGYLF